jgi:hypothetical protein
MTVRKLTLLALTVVFSGSLTASANSAVYDASLGSLPTDQGWSLEGVATPIPVVSGGVLLQGPTGDSQSWTKPLTDLDFSAAGPSFVVEADLRVISSGFRDGAIPRAGYQISAGDNAGRLFTLFLSDERVDLHNAGDGTGGVFSLFTTTDGFHTYRFSVDSGLGSPFVDNASTPLLSLAVGDPGWFPPDTASFGDGTSAASSQTELQRIAFSAVPEPSTSLLVGVGLIGLCTSSRRRASR